MTNNFNSFVDNKNILDKTQDYFFLFSPLLFTFFPLGQFLKDPFTSLKKRKIFLCFFYICKKANYNIVNRYEWNFTDYIQAS